MTEKCCRNCSELLHARSDAAYCSSACRQRAYRQRTTARPRPVDELIAELARIVSEFERHDMTTTYPGVDKPKQRIPPHTMPDTEKLKALEFSNGANRAIDALVMRLKTVRDCLADEERRRHHWAALTAAATEDLAGMERHLAAWRAV